MRRGFKRYGALLVLLVLVAASAAFADDPPAGTEPPQARIGPPGGLTSSANDADALPVLRELFYLWLSMPRLPGSIL